MEKKASDHGTVPVVGIVVEHKDRRPGNPRRRDETRHTPTGPGDGVVERAAAPIRRRAALTGQTASAG